MFYYICNIKFIALGQPKCEFHTLSFSCEDSGWIYHLHEDFSSCPGTLERLLPIAIELLSKITKGKTNITFLSTAEFAIEMKHIFI